MKILQSHSKLIQIQNRLSKQSYLSRSSLPGHLDAKMFLYLETNKKYPDRKAYPHLYHWYILMKQFALSSVQTWLKKGEYHEDDGLVTDFINIKTNQKILASILENKKQKTQQITSEQLKLHRSDDLSNQQIEYIMDIKLKENEMKMPKQFATAFLIDQQQNINQERIQVQELTVFNQQRRIRLIAKMNSQKFQKFKNKISHLEGVETFQSKKKQKKFKTVNSQSNMNFIEGVKQGKE